MTRLAKDKKLKALAVVLGITVVVCLPARADESSVWELKPYRIQVLLVPDWDPIWSDQQLDQISRSTQLRAQAEIGRPWEIAVDRASLPLRRSVLTSESPVDLQDFGQLLAPYRDRDKVIIVLLRVDPKGRVAVAWELDWASTRWTPSRRHRATAGGGVQQAAFESIASVVSPLGLVKLASGQRVVLRKRAALLPERNHRRASVRVGSVFEMVRRHRDPVRRTEEPPLLVVQEIGEQGIVCEVSAQTGNRIERNSLDSWIAIQSRLIHANTQVQLTRQESDSERPLTECEVWVSEDRADRGTLVGTPNAVGEITLPATGTVQWLMIRVGAVTLREYCVLAGARRRQTIHTKVTRAELLHADVLASCCDDVAQLVALRDVYLARHQHRVEAGRDEDAATLMEEMQTVLEQRSSESLKTIRQRQSEMIARHAKETRQFDAQWAELMETLERLRPKEGG